MGGVPRTQSSAQRCIAEPGPNLFARLKMGPGSAMHRYAHRARDTMLRN